MTKKLLLNLNHSEGYEDEFQVEIQLNKSARARKISLRVKPELMRVVLTVPYGIGVEKQAMKFLESKKNWLWQIFKKQKDSGVEIGGFSDADSFDLKFGNSVKFFGKDFVLEQAEGRGLSRVDFESGKIFVSGDENFLTRRLENLKKKCFDEYLRERVAYYFGLLQAISSPREVFRITVKNVSSRWGSCSSGGNLNFAMKLCNYDEATIDYVVAHEVCHLSEMNHSQDFWELVRKIYEVDDGQRFVSLAKAKLKGVL